MAGRTGAQADTQSRSHLDRLASRSWVTLPAVALIAVMPWLVPWQQLFDGGGFVHPGGRTDGQQHGWTESNPAGRGIGP